MQLQIKTCMHTLSCSDTRGYTGEIVNEIQKRALNVHTEKVRAMQSLPKESPHSNEVYMSKKNPFLRLCAVEIEEYLHIST
jgi:hypothetical protein